MAAEPEVVVEASAEDLARNTAAQALETLRTALTQRPVAHLVVTGGSILEQVLAALAQPGSIDWQRVHVWWGDERFVPADSPDRNDRPALTKLFDHVDVDPAKVHRMPAAGAEFGDDAETAATAYAADLAAAASGGPVPRFDLILLGVGPDGHCASLFPGHPGTRVIDKSVIAVHDSPKPPPTRLSLTFPTIEAASEVWVIASGEGKADAVAQALGGADRQRIPSAGARGRERTRWLLDRESAANLPTP
jgi:6-phosphogluconolactonase